MYRLRVVYGKSKDAMYISQDDTIKIFTDAFEKAMMPFVKSEVTGRIDINFAHPLTDGYTSTGEIFDMYLSEDRSKQDSSCRIYYHVCRICSCLRR